MGRECRRVPRWWQHPRDETGDLIPLLSGSFSIESKTWKEHYEKWQQGLRHEDDKWIPIEEKNKCSYDEWHGPAPKEEDYMPDWREEEKTHYQMYEDTSEGTPISPVMATPEELARWLVDNNASAFADQTASYEGWLRVCQGDWACCAVISRGKMTPGVDMP